MSWLSDRLGIHLNLRPLAAPAGAVVGGIFGGAPGAALGAGLAKTADNKLHGDSWGHALGQGALNAAGYGLGAEFAPQFFPGLKGAGGAASGAGATAADAGIPDTPMLGSGAAESFAPSSASLGSTAAPSQSSALLSGLKGAGSVLKDNPLVAGQVASGVLNARQGSQQLDFEKQQYNDEQERRKRIAQILGPIYQQMMAGRTPVAPNPYSR